MIINPVVESCLQAKKLFSVGFGDGGVYDTEMAYAYSRTVSDVKGFGSCLDIIEFGCFTGIVSASLSRLGHRVTASDVDFVLADPNNSSFLASEVVKLAPHNLSVLPLPFASDSYDLVVFTEVLEHLNFNPLPLLSEFRRILRPSGAVYIATPNLVRASNRAFMIKGKSFSNPIHHLRLNLQANTGMSVGLHWREYTKSELIELFEESGFALQSHCFSLLAPSLSRFPRRQLVKMMYTLLPSLMPGQIAVFVKERA